MRAALALSLAVALAAPLSAQTVDPNATSTAAATAPAVSADTAPPAVDLSGAGDKPEPPPPPKKPAPPPNPIRVKIHKESASWEPVSIKAGGSPEGARSYFSWRQHRGKKGAATGGEHSKAKAEARLYSAGEDRKLVISVFPDALKARRAHIELRYLVVEGFLEGVQVVSVTAAEGGGPLDDARMLTAKGVDFQEDSPASGAITISAIDARPSKRALNAGRLSLAAFAENELNPKTLGLVSLEYSAKGLTGPPKR